MWVISKTWSKKDQYCFFYLRFRPGLPSWGLCVFQISNLSFSVSVQWEVWRRSFSMPKFLYPGKLKTSSASFQSKAFWVKNFFFHWQFTLKSIKPQISQLGKSQGWQRVLADRDIKQSTSSPEHVEQERTSSRPTIPKTSRSKSILCI